MFVACLLLAGPTEAQSTNDDYLGLYYDSYADFYRSGDGYYGAYAVAFDENRRDSSAATDVRDNGARRPAGDTDRLRDPGRDGDVGGIRNYFEGEGRYGEIFAPDPFFDERFDDFDGGDVFTDNDRYSSSPDRRGRPADEADSAGFYDDDFYDDGFIGRSDYESGAFDAAFYDDDFYEDDFIGQDYGSDPFNNQIYDDDFYDDDFIGRDAFGGTVNERRRAGRAPFGGGFSDGRTYGDGGLNNSPYSNPPYSRGATGGDFGVYDRGLYGGAGRYDGGVEDEGLSGGGLYDSGTYGGGTGF